MSGSKKSLSEDPKSMKYMSSPLLDKNKKVDISVAISMLARMSLTVKDIMQLGYVKDNSQGTCMWVDMRTEATMKAHLIHL